MKEFNNSDQNHGSTLEDIPPVDAPNSVKDIVGTSSLQADGTTTASEADLPCAETFSTAPQNTHTIAMVSVLTPEQPQPNRASPFCRKVPRILRLSEGCLKFSCTVVGVVLGLAASVLAYALAAKGSLLGQMFNLASLSSGIPVAVSCMFFWGMAICSARWLQVRALERLTSKCLLVEAMRVLEASGPIELARQLDCPTSQASPLLRRLQAVVKQWSVGRNLQDVDFVLQQHVANDAESLQRGYSLVRTFVWALPVLGLIGTVIGIYLAVGGFASFLGGSIEDVAVIKKSLIGVTGGLSFAFLITLDGLLTSLVVMLTSTFLQTREERLYAVIQHDLTEHFIPALQQVVPAAQPSLFGGPLEELKQPLQTVAEEVLHRVGAVSDSLIATMERRQQDHRVQVERWEEALRRETEAGAKRLGEAAVSLGGNWASVSDDFISRMSQVKECLAQESVKLRDLVAQQASGTVQLHNQLLAAVGEQSTSAERVAQTLATVAAANNTALERQAALQTAIRQLSEANLPAAFARFADALALQARETHAATAATHEIAGVSQRVLAAQQTLQSAIGQIHEVGLVQAMDNLREAMKALSPILSGFRGPFVLQAVPAPVKTDGNGYGEVDDCHCPARETYNPR